jgi:site-specific recombinase XerD
MLKLWRRHLPECPHLDKGRTWLKCACPIWVDGSLDGRRVRKSLDTLNWQRANQIVHDMESDLVVVKNSSISDAVPMFISDCEKRGLKEPTIKKYRETLNPLLRWCVSRDITTVRSLDFPTIKGYVRDLTDSTLTVGKKIERLRTFFVFCHDEGWCDSNPATKIKKPKVTNSPVIPFTAAQHKAIISAIGKYPIKNSFGYDNRKRVLAFVLVLRYTALRMSDVVQLRRAAIDGGRMLLRTTKTGATIYTPLPKALLEALKVIENESPFYFWSGEGKLKSVISTWQRIFNELLKLAKVAGHPHMYRHMLAIEMLEKGALVEQVAAVLGNSPQIVYKHYSPWVQSRQRALEKSIKKVWA